MLILSLVSSSWCPSPEGTPPAVSLPPSGLPLHAASAPPASLTSLPQDCPFVVRGPTYLKDRKKIPAGMAAFTLGAMDMVAIDSPVQHIARFLPSIR